MDNKKTFIIMLILAVVFVVAVWVLPIFNKNKKTNEKKEIVNQQNSDNTNDKNIDKNKNEIKKNDVISNVSSFYEIVDAKKEILENIPYENDKIKIILSNKDAIIKNAFIKYNINGNNYNSIDLVSPKNKDDGALRLKLGAWDKDLTLSQMTGGADLYHFEKIDNLYIFTAKFKDKEKKQIYTITKKYKFLNNENYFILDVEVSRDDKELVKFNDSDIVFSIGWGPYLGVDSREKKENKAHKDYISYLNGEKVVNLDTSNKLFKNNLFYSLKKDVNNDWISSNSHFFAAVIYPVLENPDKSITADKKTSYDLFVDYRDKANKNYYCGLSRKLDDKNIRSQFKIFLLPKTSDILNKYPEFKRKNIIVKSFLEEEIMWGIGNLIRILLKFIYGFVKNYGIAIIILTFLIKMLLYPLTYKSLQSQEKLGKLQPKIKELQEKYSGKPELLNAETMKLYKKEGINPFGGCLPMLLQMPILFAMYGLLGNMVELKDAHFLWIKDLSIPDAVWFFPNNFTIPLANINSINILPIIMIAMQIASSFLMPDIKTNKQAQMMIWMMPIMFFVLFYNISSGLVLYWTVMNILNTAQQLLMNYLKKRKAAATA